VLSDWSEIDRRDVPLAVMRTFPAEVAGPRSFFDVTCLTEPSGVETTQTIEFVSGVIRDCMKGATDRSVDLIALNRPAMAFPSRLLASLFNLRNFPDADIESTLTPVDLLVVFLTTSLAALNDQAMLEFRAAGGDCVLAVSNSMLAHCKADIGAAAQAIKAIAPSCHLILVEDEVGAREFAEMLESSFVETGEEVRILTCRTAGLELEDACRKIALGGLQALPDSEAQKWHSGGRRRFTASSDYVRVSVGERSGDQIHSCGVQGHLIFGPYINLSPGNYQIKVAGRCIKAAGAVIELLGQQNGEKLILREPIEANTNLDEPLFSAYFSLVREISRAEVRIFVTSATIMQIFGYEILTHGESQ
jgi:hypothetical protein